MRTTVDELKVLEHEGLSDEHFSKTVKVNLKYIIADTPCRASMNVYVKSERPGALKPGEPNLA